MNYSDRFSESPKKSPSILVYPTPLAVAQAAAQQIATLLNNKPAASIVFPTGSTPLPLYELLRQSPTISWEQARLFQLDEYVAPPGSRQPLPYQTFANFLRQNLWNFIGGQKFYLEQYFDCPAAYEDLVTRNEGPDLTILGIGKNGHIAFNEPGTPPDSTTRLVDLAPETIQRNFGVLNQQGLPTQAITLGIQAILKSKQILLLATGTDKQAITRQAFSMSTAPTLDCPASWLKTHDQVTVLTDFPL